MTLDNARQSFGPSFPSVSRNRRTNRLALAGRPSRGRSASLATPESASGHGPRTPKVDATRRGSILNSMKGEFTAIIEEAPEGGYWAICPEVPGANGQGATVEEAKISLRDAIKLIFEDRVEDARRGLPEDAIQTVVAV